MLQVNKSSEVHVANDLNYYSAYHTSPTDNERLSPNQTNKNSFLQHWHYQTAY